MPPVSSPGSQPTSRPLPHPRFGSPDAARVRFRRAVMLLLMTLVMPGSAQLVAGNRRVGRLALRTWLVLLGTLALVAAVGYLWHGVLFFLGTNTVVLEGLHLLLAGLAVGWAVLFLDAWRLGQPLELLQKQRLAVVGINGVLCFSVAGSLLFASHVVAVQRGFITTMFGDGKVTEATHGRYNVLLLGGDSGADRWGLRPDSISVASIDQETGRTVLFGIPRNMADFPFPKGSVMAKQFPTGFDCEGCTINGLATWAADHTDLFKGVDDPGVEATIQGVEGITGLSINYYAMVNLQGFRSLVQAVGGLKLNVRDRIPIGGGGGPVTGYIEPGVQRLNGFETLWFARSRESADDYSRMARQKCVMNAMLEQLSPKTVITKFEAIAEASSELVTTNLPASQLGKFAELAMRARTLPVSTVSFVPPRINTGDPDVDRIHKMVDRAIERSQAKDYGDVGTAEAAGPTRKKDAKKAQQKAAEQVGGPGFSTDTDGVSVGGSLGNITDGYAANRASDLSSAC